MSARIDAFAARPDQGGRCGRKARDSIPAAVLVVNIGSVCEPKGPACFSSAPIELLKAELPARLPRPEGIQFLMVGARPGGLPRAAQARRGFPTGWTTPSSSPESGRDFRLLPAGRYFRLHQFRGNPSHAFLLESAGPSACPFVTTQRQRQSPRLLAADEGLDHPRPGDRYQPGPTRSGRRWPHLLPATAGGRTRPAPPSLHKYHDARSAATALPRPRPGRPPDGRGRDHAVEPPGGQMVEPGLPVRQAQGPRARVEGRTGFVGGAQEKRVRNPRFPPKSREGFFWQTSPAPGLALPCRLSP